jgi:hypothetical protein
LVVNRGWDVVGFAINHALYADIALQRTPPKPEPMPADPPPPPTEAEGAPLKDDRDAVASGFVGRIRALAKKLGSH